VERLSEGLHGLTGLRTPIIEPECTHAYYDYPLILDVETLGVSRLRIAEALMAEGLDISTGYQNLHLLPMYQKKIAYGSRGFPWTSDICHRDVDYSKGICSVAEELNDSTFLGFGMCVYDLSDQDIDLIVLAFRKVWASIDKLRKS
jgi:hypothetical protein